MGKLNKKTKKILNNGQLILIIHTLNIMYLSKLLNIIVVVVVVVICIFIYVYKVI
jgi:hypothetical protein